MNKLDQLIEERKKEFAAVSSRWDIASSVRPFVDEFQAETARLSFLAGIEAAMKTIEDESNIRSSDKDIALTALTDLSKRTP